MTDVRRLDPVLRAELVRVATAQRLLVAVDVDGTISELAPRPQDATVAEGAIHALRELSRTPRTTVAVLSGRSRHELVPMLPIDGDVVLAGSHGAERSAGLTLSPAQAGLRDRLVALVEAEAAAVPGALAEPKTTGAALHVRLVEEPGATAALQRLRRAAETIPEAHLRTGKAVLELSAVPTGKGAALEAIRAECDAVATVFVGDDDTDEEAFAVLGPADLGVKVGAGDTSAQSRVSDPAAVVVLLEALALERSRATTDEAGG
jgi:trehalose 6-phosphate phosphatase